MKKKLTLKEEVFRMKKIMKQLNENLEMGNSEMVDNEPKMIADEIIAEVLSDPKNTNHNVRLPDPEERDVSVVRLVKDGSDDQTYIEYTFELMYKGVEVDLGGPYSEPGIDVVWKKVLKLKVVKDGETIYEGQDFTDFMKSKLYSVVYDIFEWEFENLSDKENEEWRARKTHRFSAGWYNSWVGRELSDYDIYPD